LAQPPISHPDDPERHRRWEEQLLLLRRPNTWADVASLPAYAVGDGGPPFSSVGKYLRRAVELIGIDKLLWGSDIPGTLVHATYPQLLHYIERSCDFLSPADRRKLLGQNAMAAYPGLSAG